MADPTPAEILRVIADEYRRSAIVADEKERMSGRNAAVANISKAIADHHRELGVTARMTAEFCRRREAALEAGAAALSTALVVTNA